MATRKKSDPARKIVAENRRARFNYEIDDTVEAGLVLQGTEVKALRAGEASIKESYAEVRDGQVVVVSPAPESF